MSTISRITVVTLLLIILVDAFGKTTDPRILNPRKATQVHMAQIRKCRCRVLQSGKMMCPSPLFPKHNTKEVLISCFCSKQNRHKFPEFQRVCRSQMYGTPL